MTADKSLQKIIIEGLHLEHLDQKHQENLLADVGDIIFRRVMLSVLPNLSSSDKEKLSVLVEKSDSSEEIVVFMQTKIKDLDRLIFGEIEKIKQDISSFLHAVNPA